MRYFCTCIEGDLLSGGLALYQSLLVHAGSFELIVLCMDAESDSALRRKSLPHIRLLPVAELTDRHPTLAAARSDRTAHEFLRTCKPWLVWHLLPQLPAGALLAYLDASLGFFGPLQPVEAELGDASVGIFPQRLPADHSHLGRHGEFNSAWIYFRHDATGLACAADWAAKCADWCFTFVEPHRYAEQKYLDAWPGLFSGTRVINHPGALVAPWNIAGRTVTRGQTGLLVGGQTLICYHFAGLTHLDRSLYDSGLQRYGAGPSPELRELVYHPYLQQLAAGSPEMPDIVPPVRAADDRSETVIPRLLERVQAAEVGQAASELALEQTRREVHQFMDDDRAARIERDRYTREVELERDRHRQDFFDTRQKLLAFHEDLVRNIAYIKTLHAEADMLKQAAVDREAYITNLNEQLARRETGGTGPDLTEFGRRLAPHCRDLRRILVLKYHPHLLPPILWWSAMGISVEILSSPPEFAGAPRGPVHFWAESLWDWLGGLNTLFNERSYLHANPDIAGALVRGEVPSGWDHYQRFGQREGRITGSPHFRAGLADADAVAFHSADAGPLIPCLAGRLQPYHRLFIDSCFNPATVWLPADTGRTIVYGDLMYCSQPPRAWLGTRLPAALPVAHRSQLGTEQIYPAVPDQPAAWPKLTVITACHDKAAGLEATLRSVLDQNYPNLEYIVVDGRSTDGSAGIIRRYSDRLAWSVSEKFDGPAQALNRGLAKSTGTILAWLNSGDQLAPGSLFTVAQQFLLHEPDLVAGRCAIRPGTEILPRRIHRNVLTFGQVQPLPLPELLEIDRCWRQGWFFQQPEVFFSRKLFERAGGRLREDLHSCMDYDLWVRMAKAGARILPLPEILAISGDSPVPKSADDELCVVNAALRATAGDAPPVRP